MTLVDNPDSQFNPELFSSGIQPHDPGIVGKGSFTTRQADMRCLFIPILCTLMAQARSQDTIYIRGSAYILASIQKITTNEVRYTVSKDSSISSHNLQKHYIKKIVFQDGRTDSFVTKPKDLLLYHGQVRNALKLNVFSPAFGFLQFTFERSVKPGRSIELNAAIIGLGKNQEINDNWPLRIEYGIPRDAAGASIGLGYKFIKTPDFTNRSIPVPNVLQGLYLKPVVYIGLYEENIVNHKPPGPIAERRTVAYGSLMIEIGNQWVFGELLTLDLYAGLGLCLDNINHIDHTYSNYSSENQAKHFNVFRFGKNGGAFSGGLKLGFLLGGNKD
jgi:hypothetical protein